MWDTFIIAVCCFALGAFMMYDLLGGDEKDKKK